MGVSMQIESIVRALLAPLLVACAGAPAPEPVTAQVMMTFLFMK